MKSKAVILLSLLFTLFGGCTEEKEVIKYGSIAGVVYDESVGEPIPVVKIELTPSGKTAVTGSDGSFSFINIEAKDYTIKAEKKGYESGSNDVTVVAGTTSECNLTLKRIPAYVTADKKELDFGDNLSLTTLSFNIVNSSYENLSWHIDYDKTTFILDVSPEKGTTQYGKTSAIVVKIDRTKLNSGLNESTIVVVSDNGDGSSEVRIKAIGQEKSKPSLNAKEATDITSSTAVIHGEITFAGIPSYTERGFVYDTSADPTIDVNTEKITLSVTEDSLFSTKIKGLSLGVKYYVRAFAINEIGITYSNQISFTTISSLPVVSIQEPDHFDANNKSVSLHGSIDYLGDPQYSEKGFVYCLGRNTPTASDSIKKVSGGGLGLYDAVISGLQLGNTYSVRSYAKNEGGYAYSTTVQFTLSGTLPTVSVSSASDINLTELSAVLHGKLESLGSPAATTKGFVYSSVNETPSLDDQHVDITAGRETGSYYATITQLELNKTYYVRAFAKNEAGLNYSSETIMFNTSPSAPTISIRSVTDINLSAKTALFKGSISSVGDPAYNERGFVYSTTNNIPNYNDSYVIVEGEGAGTYEISVSNLVLGKTYYVRAYAKNEVGITYSDDVVDFSTVPIAATVKMRSVTSVDRVNLTALYLGAIETIGDPPYIEKGFVYSSTNNTPTINDSSVKVEGSGIGTYETKVSNLIFGKTYYVRAYAINENVITYSEDVVSFDILGTTPIVSVGVVDGINLSSLTANLNGYVSEVGYPAISERGFVYSSNNNTPTINDSKVTADGDATGGSYSVQINNLALDKTYYVKAYVSNSLGLFYSENTISFSTEATFPVVSVSSSTNMNLEALTANVSGRIEDAGNPEYTEKGFVYGYNNKIPTVENDIVINVSGSQTGTFSTTLSDLALGKKYYLRAFAKNAKGIAYSDTVSFFFDQTLPKVQTENVTNFDYKTTVAILHGSITDVGNPAYQERGFVLSTTYNQPTINDQKIVVSGSATTGNFEYRLTEFSKTENTYVRAYAIVDTINDKGVVYGESVLLFDASYMDMGDYIIMADKGIAVQKTDIGSGFGYYEDMERLCTNSRVGGYANWRLPTKNELTQLYNIKDKIGGFKNACYWTSSFRTEYNSTQRRTYYYYYYIHFGSGASYDSLVRDNTSNDYYHYNNCYARAVCNVR